MTNPTNKKIRQQLLSLADKKYQIFMLSLIPNCNNLLGVRMPILRKLAKFICQSNWKYFLDTPPQYFEETILQGLIIGIKAQNLGDMQLIKNFVPKINNWAICDTFCCGLKLMKFYPRESLNFIQPYLKSNSEFEVRFALVSLLNHFILPQYLSQIFQILDNFNHQGYYAQMAAAWLLSTCFTKFPDETSDYLKQSKLNDQTFNRAIQKIIESHQTPKNLHPFLKKLKR